MAVKSKVSSSPIEYAQSTYVFLRIDALAIQLLVRTVCGEGAPGGLTSSWTLGGVVVLLKHLGVFFDPPVASRLVGASSALVEARYLLLLLLQPYVGIQVAVLAGDTILVAIMVDNLCLSVSEVRESVDWRRSPIALLSGCHPVEHEDGVQC